MSNNHCKNKNQLNRELKREQEKLAIKNSQREKQLEQIKKFESELYEAHDVDKPKLKSYVESLKQELNNIEKEIDKLEEIIENINKDLNNIEQELGNSSDNKDTGVDTEDYEEDDLDEEDSDEYDNLDEDYNPGETSENGGTSSVNDESKEFLGNFSKVNSNYYESIYEKLKNEQKNTEKSNYSNQNNTAECVQISDLIQTQNTLNKTVLYVATFFPNLTNQDFERIVSFLLEGKPIDCTVAINEDSEDEADISKKTFVDKKISYDLLKENGYLDFDKIREECHLTLFENSSSIIDFDSRSLRNDLKKHFKNPWLSFLENQFKRSKLLLLDSTTDVVATNAVELSVEMANLNSIVYGRQWLSELLSLFRLFTMLPEPDRFGLTWFEIAKTLFPERDKQEEFSLFARFLSQVDQQYRGEFLIYRVAFLMQRMLESANLKPVIDDFLQQELDAQNPETVLALFMLLNSAPNFDWLSWAEKLLNEKNGMISFHTREIFFSQLKQSRKNIYEILTEIKKWIPKKQLEQKDYTQSQVYALRLIYKYS